jgi:sec-independent protein translocase protein TatC
MAVARARRVEVSWPVLLLGALGRRDEGPEMTLAEHLGELRGRLIKALLAVAIGTVAAFAYSEVLMDFLLAPAGLANVVCFEPQCAMLLQFQIALTAGIGLASPVVFYQAVRFVLPAMTATERRVFFTALPFVGLFFAAGVLFGYVVALPLAMEYLLGMTMHGRIVVEPRAQGYIDFVTTFLLGLGAAFQLPVVLWVLARLGLVTADRLVRFRRFALLGAFVIAAVVTPTPDPINQALIAVPLWLLYEVGVVMARLAGPAG